MKRILIVSVLGAALATGVVVGPASAGPITPPLTDLSVVPDIGRPGDAFTVSGGGCERLEQEPEQAAGASVGGRFAPRGNGPSQNFSVAVAVAFPAPVATTTTPTSAGDWSVNFTVPQGTPPGVYEVSAVCLFGGVIKKFGVAQTPFPYESGTYTVIGDPSTPLEPAPAAPVVAAPRFTG